MTKYSTFESISKIIKNYNNQPILFLIELINDFFLICDHRLHEPVHYFD